MRTTVTLDPDVDQLLRDEAHRTRRSFKAVLNDAVRAALRQEDRGEEPFVVEARPMGLRPGLDPSRLAELADELEVDSFLTVSRVSEKPRR